MENSVKIAVIPARGGSKRLPRKNLLPLCGEPVISYPIRAALESDLFDRVIVSTDDEEIAERAEHFGAEIPFMRPKALADDYTGTGPVVRHAIEWLEQKGHEITATCCIYPTAVFVTPQLIRRGWEMLERSDYPYVLPPPLLNSQSSALLLWVPITRQRSLIERALQNAHRTLNKRFMTPGTCIGGRATHLEACL